jgi:hypothetical protein
VIHCLFVQGFSCILSTQMNTAWTMFHFQ